MAYGLPEVSLSAESNYVLQYPWEYQVKYSILISVCIQVVAGANSCNGPALLYYRFG
jgi:hypothetical protein